MEARAETPPQSPRQRLFDSSEPAKEAQASSATDELPPVPPTPLRQFTDKEYEQAVLDSFVAVQSTDKQRADALKIHVSKSLEAMNSTGINSPVIKKFGQAIKTHIAYNRSHNLEPEEACTAVNKRITALRSTAKPAGSA
eukprot:m.43828 g.43828  ORF g.43828 m.43828 type:complete len:140 (+) comp10797_c0_seq3:2-421(+)